jgi:hypothetical protein
MDQVSVWDLLEAFDTVCKAIGTSTYTGHIKDDTPIDLYQIEILHRLQTEGPLTFERIFESRPNRLVMIGRFLAMLELIRDKLIWAEQGEGSPHQIYLRALTDEPAEQAVQRAILTVDEGPDAGPSRMEAPQHPPIPIKEIPASSHPQAPEPQRGRSRQQAQTSEPTNEEAPQRPEDAPSDSEATAPASRELPIPIAELPPKTRPQADHKQATQSQAEASNDDLPFDNPPPSP